MPTIKEKIAEIGPWPGSLGSYDQKDCDDWDKKFKKVTQSVAGMSYVNAGKAVDEVENKLRHANVALHKVKLEISELEKALEIAKHVQSTLGNVETT
jgi:hypothetical protein